MIDLAERVKELVAEDPQRARDKDILVRLLVKELAGQEKELFRFLLTEYVNHHVRRPSKPRGTGAKPPARTAPSALQQPAQRALLMEQAGKRPLYIPALHTDKHDGWVEWANMTPEYWKQYIESRQRIARVSSSLATWGGQNLQALHSHGAKTSGELPDGVRESLLRRMPPASGRELATANTPRELTRA